MDDELEEQLEDLRAYDDPNSSHSTVEITEDMTIEEIVARVIDAVPSIQASGTPYARGQWARGMGMYKLIGDTSPELPPGYYDLTASNDEVYFVSLPARTDKLIRFPHAQVDKVLTEIEKFWEREALFREFGLPYKRGILLYGPPGSGKTCALSLVARDVVDRGGIVLIWNTNIFPTAYRQLRHVQPNTPVVVLMEDLDAILETHKESEVLNVLDGAQGIHKVVFLATTNYPQNLGERITNRPSRFDKRIKVPHPNDVGRMMYLESLVDGHKTDIDLDKYVRDTKGMSLAHLKELFLSTVLIGTDYADAIHDLREMHENKASSLYDTDDMEDYMSRGHL